MKIGDLVRYDPVRYDNYSGGNQGMVIKLYTRASRGERQVILRREMADVLFSYGVVSDDTYEFEVANEDR